MKKLLCDVLELKNIKNTDYFVVRPVDEANNYLIRKNRLSKYGVEVGKKYHFNKIKSEGKKAILELLSEENSTKPIAVKTTTYQDKVIYDFKILSFSSIINRKNEIVSIICLEDLDKNVLTVPALKWQNENTWKFETLKCEVEYTHSNGLPRLINKDFRHPVYEKNKDYEFEIIGEKIKHTENGAYHVFIVKGEDNCAHEVNMLTSQKINNIKIDKIQCKVLDITYRLNLYQINFKDPYYVNFDKIENDKYFEKKYFTQLFKHPDKYDKDLTQLIEQYNSCSAFWVFTFANKILPKLFRDNIDRKDYKQAKEINNLVIKFEEWIISKGIITSFQDEEIRLSTRHKAKSALESAKILDTVLSKLCTNRFDFLNDETFFNDDNNLIERFYYIIKFSNIEVIAEGLLVTRLQTILTKIDFSSTNELYYLDRLIKHFSFNKKVFMSEEEKENFSLSSSRVSISPFTFKETKFLKIAYCEILLANKLSMHEHVNILCGQLLKLFTKPINDIAIKELILFNSYKYLDNYQSSSLHIPFVFDEDIDLDLEILNQNLELFDNNYESWNELEKLFETNSTFSVRLTKKSKTGFEVTYKDIRGFLPHHHIKEYALKNSAFEECDFTINCRCLNLSKAFNFFIIQQITTIEGLDYKNNIPFIKDKIYDAIIKNVVGYGLFLSTNAGEGLLHISDIFDFNWNNENISKYFKKGQRIKVVLHELSTPNKISFSFIKIKEHSILYYNEFVDSLFTNFESSSSLNNEKELEQYTYFEKAQIEKAFCIEQFAVLQSDIKYKLQNFQIAKQFYTNAKHARSYLINIYTSYFEILLRIKETIQTSALENIIQIKKDAQDIKHRINQKTIETFPDSDKLIFFLDIVGIFNEKSNETFQVLFNYVKMYSSNESLADLRTIAKITLANNLIISESKEDTDFILKNLKLIFDYLSNGILSLKESVEDRSLREYKEQILYWREKIKEDESETLEFKSSLFTPILDVKSKNKLEILNKNQNKSDKIKYEIDRINGDLARKIIIHSALKTLAAFANSSGGILLIGVDNNKDILGLECEYTSNNPKLQYPNRDGFGLFFDNLIRTYLGDSFSSLMNRQFLKFPEGDILIIQIRQSSQEVFLLKNEEGKEVEQLYIRNLSSSKELTGSELAKFIRNKHLGQLYKTFEPELAKIEN